ncbi:uncharacterized protein J3D65DRAFT_210944 [Phyllosticta citribraziliensis]|uniref:Uncharacterized protein n=1 Tax=Phyllosticta citribraziliensis TaxID=989973 RepID=A0ABR1M5W1_9PEZI
MTAPNGVLSASAVVTHASHAPWTPRSQGYELWRRADLHAARWCLIDAPPPARRGVSFNRGPRLLSESLVMIVSDRPVSSCIVASLPVRGVALGAVSWSLVYPSAESPEPFVFHFRILFGSRDSHWLLLPHFMYVLLWRILGGETCNARGIKSYSVHAA